MAVKDVVATVIIGGYNLPVYSLSVSEDFDAASTTFTLVTDSSGSQVSVNDTVTTVVMGYSGDSGSMMTDGYVDSIVAERPPATYTITGRDKLKLAADYFIVEASMDSDDFFNPRLDNGSTSPEDIISDILDECGLSANQDLDSTGGAWTLGTAEEGTEFQLVSAWDAIQQVTIIGVWKVWVTPSGSIRFSQVTPEPGTPSGSLTTGNSGNILHISYSKSDTNLRNKVVVIGAPLEGGGEPYYTGTASASSPYLPVGYYKTTVISTDLLTDEGDCYDSAAANLARWNKLDERVSFEAEGDASIHAQDTLTITEAFTGVSGDWFIYEITHTIDGNGYTMTGTGVK